MFKQYLRECDPLLTFARYDVFVSVAELTDVGERFAKAREAVRNLAPLNIVALMRVLPFLCTVASHSATNRYVARRWPMQQFADKERMDIW